MHLYFIEDIQHTKFYNLYNITIIQKPNWPKIHIINNMNSRTNDKLFHSTTKDIQLFSKKSYPNIIKLPKELKIVQKKVKLQPKNSNESHIQKKI